MSECLIGIIKHCMYAATYLFDQVKTVYLKALKIFIFSLKIVTMTSGHLKTFQDLKRLPMLYLVKSGPEIYATCISEVIILNNDQHKKK